MISFFFAGAKAMVSFSLSFLLAGVCRAYANVGARLRLGLFGALSSPVRRPRLPAGAASTQLGDDALRLSAVKGHLRQKWLQPREGDGGPQEGEELNGRSLSV